MITMLASIGLPTLNNFIGEYLVLQGAAMVEFNWAVFAAIGVILSACYMLWLYQRTFFGKTSGLVAHTCARSESAREWLAIVPLIVLMVWMGTFTQSFCLRFSSNACIRGTDRRRRDVQYKLRRRLPRLKEAGQCPLTSCRRAPTTSASCPKSS